MSGLRQLLIDLGKDAELRQRYEDSPKEVMNEYKLSSDEIQAMLDKDVDKLMNLSGLDSLKSNGSVQSHDYN